MLHDQGFWPTPDDIFYLGRDEVRVALFDSATDGRSAPTPIGPTYWPAEIERRRAIIDALETQRPQPALNTPPEAITEPFTSCSGASRPSRCNSWLAGDDERRHVLQGHGGIAGAVEGLARVIASPEELDQLQEGEILVAPVTAPSWGPSSARSAPPSPTSAA